MLEALEVSKIKRVFGDRIVVKKLKQDEKIGSIFIPEPFRDQKVLRDPTTGNDAPWFGEVAIFGLDTRYQEAYELTEGENVLFDPEGIHCHSRKDNDGEEYIWVPEEFAALHFVDGKPLPIGDRVLIKPDPEQEKTNAGLYLPDQEKSARDGKVVAVGKGLLRGDRMQAMVLKKGDRVMYGKYSGYEFTLKGEKYVLMHECDVLGLVEEA